MTSSTSGTAIDDGSVTVPLTLPFLECGACAGLSFPADSFGCQHCGADPDQGTSVIRPARGELLNFVTVHVQVTSTPAAPYVIGRVRLAPDVIEEVLLRVDSEDELRRGMAVQAVSVEDVDDAGVQIIWFAPEAAEPAVAR